MLELLEDSQRAILNHPACPTASPHSLTPLPPSSFPGRRGNVLELLEDIQELRPQFFPSVPRLWNRIYDKVIAQVGGQQLIQKRTLVFIQVRSLGMLKPAEASTTGPSPRWVQAARERVWWLLFALPPPEGW